MEYSFPQYLLSKQSVDDRALNRHVYETLVARLPKRSVRIIEAGAGIGTMLVRLLRLGLLKKADYVAVDELAENIAYALDWIPRWVGENPHLTAGRLGVESSALNQLRLFDETRDIRVTFEQADILDFIQEKSEKADLLIAHAFLDLLPMPEALPKLFSLLKPTGLAWLTINFDGLTTLEPAFRLSASKSVFPSVSLLVDLDAHLERLYHQTMNTRPTGGDSQSGRHLFGHLRALGAEILAAGASDWVVFPQNGHYPADEAYFLHFILYFFENSLSGHPELDAAAFAAWLAERHAQIERGELVYIAHQMDFLVNGAPGRDR